MSRTDACDMKKMGDGAISPSTDGAISSITDGTRPPTTDGTRSPATDGARPSTTDGAISPTTDVASSPATDDDHAREASAGCSVSACHMDRLPAELLQQVLSYLSLWKQLGAQRVSRRWQEAVQALLRRRQQLDTRAERIPGGWRNKTLSRVLRLMPSLRVLRGRLPADTCSRPLDIVATHCTSLVEIELYGLRINDDSLRRLCLACPSLEKVRIREASEFDVRVLLQHLPTLRTLELNYCSSVTGQCFSLLPASLRRLSVAFCNGLQSDALLHVGRRCPQLRELDVSAVPRLQPAHVSAALSGCPLLERLTACRLDKPLERCLPPAGLPGLRHLNVAEAYGVTDSTLRQLPGLLPALHTLNIQRCRFVTEEGLLHVCRWKVLVSLDLSWLDCVTDAVLDRLHELPLREIHLAYVSAFTEQGIVRLVLACKSLTLLDVRWVRHTLITATVNQLVELLPPSRNVTLCVEGKELADLPPLRQALFVCKSGQLSRWTVQRSRLLKRL